MKNTVFVVSSKVYGKEKNLVIVADTPQEALKKAKIRYGILKGSVQKLPLKGE